jgi:hypothetical protein
VSLPLFNGLVADTKPRERLLFVPVLWAGGQASMDPSSADEMWFIGFAWSKRTTSVFHQGLPETFGSPGIIRRNMILRVEKFQISLDKYTL